MPQIIVITVLLIESAHIAYCQFNIDFKEENKNDKILLTCKIKYQNQNDSKIRFCFKGFETYSSNDCPDGFELFSSEVPLFKSTKMNNSQLKIKLNNQYILDAGIDFKVDMTEIYMKILKIPSFNGTFACVLSPNNYKTVDISIKEDIIISNFPHHAFQYAFESYVMIQCHTRRSKKSNITVEISHKHTSQIRSFETFALAHSDGTVDAYFATIPIKLTGEHDLGRSKLLHLNLLEVRCRNPKDETSLKVLEIIVLPNYPKIIYQDPETKSYPITDHSKFPVRILRRNEETSPIFQELHQGNYVLLNSYIHCTFEGRPPANVTWRRFSGPVDFETIHTSDGSSSLRLRIYYSKFLKHPTLLMFESIYDCIARINVGVGLRPKSERIIFIGRVPYNDFMPLNSNIYKMYEIYMVITFTPLLVIIFIRIRAYYWKVTISGASSSKNIRPSMLTTSATPLKKMHRSASFF